MKKQDPALYKQIEQETAHPPPMPIWETRYYDFYLLDPNTYDEKVHYIHQNPVRAGLAPTPPPKTGPATPNKPVIALAIN